LKLFKVFFIDTFKNTLIKNGIDTLLKKKLGLIIF